MNYDVKKINENFPYIHSRYYIDTNGIIYTSLSQNTNRIMVNGKRLNVNKFRKTILENLNRTNKMLIAVPETDKKYYMLYDGTVLQRLSTRIKENKQVTVCLMYINGNKRGNQTYVSRLVAGSFIGNVDNMEVHHKDGDRTNNKVNNLAILTMEKHRGKGNFNKNHKHLKV